MLRLRPIVIAVLLLSAAPAHAGTGDTVIIAVEAPSSMFPPDDYQFSLSGATSSGELEPIDRYPFRTVTE